MAVKKDKPNLPKKLNPKQELFCKLFATDRDCFANGVQAYAEAYNIDTSKPNAYNSARASASELLTNPNILSEINKLLEMGGLNDVVIDKELLFIITQNADFGAKIAAIREYNKLKQRITEKREVKVTLPKPIMDVTDVHSDDSDKKD